MESGLYIRTLPALDHDVTDIRAEDVFGLWNLSHAKIKALKANPNSGEQSPVQVLGIVDNKVVGQETVFPIQVKAKDKVYTAIAGSGLYVHEDYRKSMLGVSLITKREELSVDGIALGCGLSSLALPAHLMFDYLCFSMPRLMWVFKSRAVIEKKLGIPAISLLMSRLVDVPLWLWGMVFKAITIMRTRKLVVELADHADGQIAKLIDQDPHPYACKHTTAWFNWQLKSSFTNDIRGKQKLFVIKDRESHIRGFFMYKIRFHETASQRGYRNLLLGSLMEWQSSDQQKLSHAIIALVAILEMRKDAVDAVEICTDEKPMFDYLKKWMLFHVGELSFVLRATEVSPLRKLEGWNNQKKWRLRPAEGDNGLS